MGAKESAETREGLRLMREERKTVREAARLAGVAPSTLMRAKARRAAKDGKQPPP